MRPLRVVHVTTVDMSVRHLLLNQLVSLRARGFDVSAASASGLDIVPVAAAGIRHFDVPFTRRITPLQDLRAFWKLWKLFRRERFTIVHTHQVKAAVFGQLAARLAGVPIVVNTIHGFYFHDRTAPLKRRAWILLERLTAKLSAMLLSQNREDIETAVQEGICRRDKIRHIGNGIDVQRFDPSTLDRRRIERLRHELSLRPGDIVIGFVGRLVREKGLLELMDAIRRLRGRFPSLRLLVIGPVDSDKPDAITETTAARYAIDDIIVFTGYRHDMPELYALMAVCVLPSHREGMPRSPMEASAMGVPCIATDIRGCREVVREGENGLLVAVDDAEALADAIARVLGDPLLAARLAARARMIACEQFDERLVFAHLHGTYISLLEQKGFDPASRGLTVGAVNA